MSWLILGLSLLAGFALCLRWFATAEPKKIIKVLKWLLLLLVLAIIAFLAFTGRLAWAIALIPVLFAWAGRIRFFTRLVKNFSRAANPQKPTGQSSTVETLFLRMELDHDSGEMRGSVLNGALAGRDLSDLNETDFAQLYKECHEDEQSRQVLEAYLDRRFGEDWREGRSGGATETGGPMSRIEAFDILGLSETAKEAEIQEAYHRLIAKLHPDHGGSTYLAAKLNQARDVLLGK